MACLDALYPRAWLDAGPINFFDAHKVGSYFRADDQRSNHTLLRQVLRPMANTGQCSTWLSQRRQLRRKEKAKRSVRALRKSSF